MEPLSLHTHNLLSQLREDIRNSSSIYILSSFVMYSGIRAIYDDLHYALAEGADVKILTGDYLYITQPKALQELLTLDSENLEIRLWRSSGVSFHPKSFIFTHRDGGSFIVGSSNLSRSALTTGVEWNLRMHRQASPKVFEEALHHFINLFYDEKTVLINKETLPNYEDEYKDFHAQHPNLAKTWTKREEIELTLPVEDNGDLPIAIEPEQEYEVEDITPRPAQEEALTALKETVSEGYNKAMVVMATGLGKTYLAAFFAKKYKRVLFIAHREEILKQARKSFEKVLGISGGLYYGMEKQPDKPLIFASIYTLSIQEHLERFAKDEFDLIIVDEFHHAAAKSYRKILDYFEPEFLLGLTATPERTDGQNVFALCDGNVAYEINFIEAIQRGWLTPFTYYGVKDDIDYSSIRWLGQRYDQEQLLFEQLQEDRAQKIFVEWNRLKQTRTLGFCSSIEQADFLANYFTDKGIKAISLTSQTRDISREEAIKKLENLEIEIIFTVDLFNEGVDIPLVDTLLFVRPTESLVIFTQQIGRGLRKHASKDSCVIIDLIGNYRHADTKLQLLGSGISTTPDEILPKVPEDCEIHLESEVIDLLKELRRKRSPRRERIYEDYISIKQALGRRPTYREVHLYGKENSREYRQAFGGYFSFLFERKELTNDEERVYKRYLPWLQKVEKESMTKSYKMVVLKYLLDKGPEQWYKPVTPEEVAPFFHQFYMEKEYRKRIDFSNRNTKRLWAYDEKVVAQLIAKMPMEKWLDKNNDLIKFEDNLFSINFPIKKEDEDILHEMTRQICEYRLGYYFERKGNKH